MALLNPATASGVKSASMAELLTAFAFASNLAFGLELELHEALIKLGDEAGTSLDLDVVQALRKCLGEQATTGKTER